MTKTEIAYLALVLTAFASFALTLAVTAWRTNHAPRTRQPDFRAQLNDNRTSRKAA
jgi:hypothetical protein